MAEFLRSHPELEPFVLSNVRLTGTTIGAGAYGSVEEVAVPGAVCAAKKIHDFFLNPTQVPLVAIRQASAQFVRECQLMSTLRHPHIVQFLGVCFLPGSRLPALVMERLLMSLHDLLDPETDPPPPPDAPKPFFPLGLKCSILHDVASGLAYLHERSPPVIHRDLSARNVLLNSGMVAKIADLGVARIVPRVRAAATMTKAPGAGVYMPPEALEDKLQDEEKEDDEISKAKYDASIDVFSFGVVAIFTLCQIFPHKLLAATYREGGRVLGRTELERRERYTRVIYRQLREKHPLLQVIEGCLDFPEDRPSIGEVLGLLEEARAEVRDQQTDMNKLELVRALQTQPRNQENFELERHLRRELTESQWLLREKEEQLQSRNNENAELQQQLESSEREKQRVTQQLISSQRWIQELRQRETELVQARDRTQQQLREKEAELTRAEETVRRDQQQIQEMRQRETESVHARDKAEQQLREKHGQLRSSEGETQIVRQELARKERELAEAQKQRREKEEQLRSSEALVAFQLRHQETQRSKTQPGLLATAVPQSIPAAVRPGKLTVQCRQKKRAQGISRGSATTDATAAITVHWRNKSTVASKKPRRRVLASKSSRGNTARRVF